MGEVKKDRTSQTSSIWTFSSSVTFWEELNAYMRYAWTLFSCVWNRLALSMLARHVTDYGITSVVFFFQYTLFIGIGIDICLPCVHSNVLGGPRPHDAPDGGQKQGLSRAPWKPGRQRYPTTTLPDNPILSLGWCFTVTKHLHNCPLQGSIFFL